jgi:hypothetical protein
MMRCDSWERCGSKHCYHYWPHEHAVQCESRLCEWLRIRHNVKGPRRRVQCYEIEDSLENTWADVRWSYEG